jgi:hypothetical protein
VSCQVVGDALDALGIGAGGVCHVRRLTHLVLTWVADLAPTLGRRQS